MIRESLELAAVVGTLPWSETETVGGWWNRQFNPEIDILGADRAPVADALTSPQIPGFEWDRAGLVLATLSGTTPELPTEAVDLVWRPSDVIDAWRAGGSHDKQPDT